MPRAVFLLFLAAALALNGDDRKPPPEKSAPPAAEQTPAEPPEEDVTLAEKEYAFNPLQAQKELTVGNFYFKKGSYAAAAARFLEATRWNPAFADAYLRLAETHEKMGNKEKAREAYAQFLEAAPDHKRAAAIKKKLGR
ncbi:MAG: tetratricopeptide repeat protein [Bryobacteraceae bacterium]